MAQSITTTSTTLEGQLVEISLAIEALEKIQGEPNNLTIQANTDQLIATITARIPVTLAETGDSISYTPVEYLP